MSLLLAGVLFLSTIAAAWITYRPLLGIGLIGLIRWNAGKIQPQDAMPPRYS